MSKVESAQIINPQGTTDEAAHIALDGTKNYFILEKLKELGKYVISFWVKGKTAGTMKVGYGDEEKSISVTTVWQRVVFPFQSKVITNPYIYFSGTEYWLYNTKLEKGDFATSYDKNDADLEGKIESYRKETSAEILLTKESITQKVTFLEEKVRTDYYTKEETYTRAETGTLISQTQNSIVSTVKENYTTKMEFNDLQIGGRNLFPKSRYNGIAYISGTISGYGLTLLQQSGSSFVIQSKALDTVLFEIGKTYTIQFVAWSDGETRLFCDIYPDTYGDSMGLPDNSGVTVTTIKKKFVFTGKLVNASGLVPMYLRFWRYVSAPNYKIYVSDIMIEEGTKASTWNPAPEDVEVDATNKANAALASANQNTANQLKNYSTTSEVNSAIAQRADSIISTVSAKYSTKIETTNAINNLSKDTDAKISNIDTRITTTKSELQTQISQTQTSILSTVSGTYTTKSEFNSLEIGGRNLARYTYSDYSTSTNLSGDHSYIFTTKAYIIGLSVGDKVTVHLFYKYDNIVAASGHTTSVWVQGNGNVTGWSSGTFGNSPVIHPIGSGEHEFLYSFTINAERLKNQYWQMSIRHDYVQSGSATVKMIKVEKGDKATDWTPSPEQVAEEATAKANTAQANAIADTTNRLKNYSTTTQMNTAINQKGDSITSTVNVKITETREYADTVSTNAKNAAISTASSDATTKANNAKSAAISAAATDATNKANAAQANAIADTTNRLKNYSTTTQMNSAIEQKGNSIISSVSATYTTKAEFSNLQIGGRNLFGFHKGVVIGVLNGNVPVAVNEDNYGIMVSASANSTNINVRIQNLGFNVINQGKEPFTFSAHVHASRNINVHFDICDAEQNFPITTSSQKIEFTRSPNNYDTPSNYNGFVDIEIPAQTQAVTLYLEKIKIERGSKATDFTKAPEDTENEIVETKNEFNTQIAQTQNSILSTVSSTYTTKAETTTVTQNVTRIEQTANKINWLVKSGTSSSNFTLTDRVATLAASYINLHGLVTFSGLGTDAQSKINTANSTANTANNTANTANTTANTAKNTANTANSTANTAKSVADTANNKLASWSSASNTTMIDGGKIYTGSITADKIKVDDLQALNATIAGWHIGSDALYRVSNNIADPNGMYFGYNGLSIRDQFWVSSDGSMSSGNPSDDHIMMYNGLINFDRGDGLTCAIMGNYEASGLNGTGTILYSAQGGSYLLFGREDKENPGWVKHDILINNGASSDSFTAIIQFYESCSFSDRVTMYQTSVDYLEVVQRLNCIAPYNWILGKLSVGVQATYENINFYVNGSAQISDTLTVVKMLTVDKLSAGKHGSYVDGYEFSVLGRAYISQTLYVHDGPVITSDRESKYDIKDLEVDKTVNFIKSLLPSSFIYKENEFGRRHHGFIAQDVHEAMGDDDWGLYIDTSYDSTETEEFDKIENDDKIEYGKTKAKKLKPYKALRYEELLPDIVLVLQQCLNRIEKLEKLIGGK